MRNKRNNCAEAVRCLIALFAIGLGMVLLFVAAGLVDGTGSAKEVTVYGLLALASIGGGIIGLKMEADVSDVIMQYNHQGKVLARQSNNTLGIEPTEKGLFIFADLSKSRAAKGLYEEIVNGLITKRRD